MKYGDLYHPPDVEAAYDTWGANCGPCALAAVLQRPVDQLRPWLTGFETRRYMSPTHLSQALDAARAPHRRLLPSLITPPAYGLYFVQWEGPWLAPGVPVAAAYRYTHTVGVAVCEEYGLMLYDVNACNTTSAQGAWVPYEWWAEEVAPRITETIKRADGKYYIRWACQVTLQPQGENGREA